MTSELGKKASRIADAIVALVERIDGPVTLRRVEREVPGFTKQGPLSWDCHCEVDGVQQVYWDGMSKSGSHALHEVIFGRRVAVQFVRVLNYLLEGDPLQNNDWSPIVLLPAKGANLYTPQVLLCVPQAVLVPEEMKPNWRVLTPAPLKFSANLAPLFSSKKDSQHVNVVG